ncbi:MAG TPA: hypothetical protein VJV78_22180 [Polyangiales bacterium]|nr:hypothetical protein [Polyangiales bacterium]
MSKPASAAPSAGSAHAIRVVPQTHVAGSQYLGLAPGGRFALFSIGAIDLWNRKVAWVEKWIPWAVATPPDTIAIDARAVSGLRIFSLLDGRSREIAGERVVHYTLSPEIVPLQRGQDVVLVDAVQGHELMRLRVPGTALSVVAGEGMLNVLVERDTTADSAVRRFSLARFEGSSGALASSRELVLDYAALTPAPSNQYRSSPFLTFDADVGLQFGFVSGCPRCPEADRTPLFWYRQPIGAGFQASEISGDDPKLASRIPRAFLPSPAKQLPSELRAQLASLPVAAVGFVKRLGSTPDTFITGNSDRDCAWSLLEGARSSCEPPRPTPEVAAAPLPAANGCQLAVDPPERPALPGALPITCGSTLVATAYDLSATEWALMLPDGRFAGSAHATKYLAFYATDGSLLRDDEVEKLRTLPAEVARVIDANTKKGPP